MKRQIKVKKHGKAQMLHVPRKKVTFDFIFYFKTILKILAWTFSFKNFKCFGLCLFFLLMKSLFPWSSLFLDYIKKSGDHTLFYSDPTLNPKHIT